MLKFAQPLAVTDQTDLSRQYSSQVLCYCWRQFVPHNKAVEYFVIVECWEVPRKTKQNQPAPQEADIFLKLFLWTLLQLNFEKAHILCLSKELFFCCVSKDFLEGCCSTTDNKEDSCETQCRYLQPLEKRVDQQDSMKKKLAAKSEILISHFF